MDVLQTIHTQGDSRSTQTWNSLSSSQEGGHTVIISDDEDKADEKRNLFGSHVSAFSFKPDAVSVFDQKSASTLHQRDEIKCDSPLDVKVARLSPIQNILQEATNMSVSSSSSSPSLSPPPSTRLPFNLPESLTSTLRAFPTCPLCLQAFPILTATGEVLTKKFNAKKAAAKLAAFKKANSTKAITGAARLTHVQLCAFKTDTSSEAVISLIAKEQIRLDRNKRRQYNEEVSKEGVWKTLTGDAPPSTQVQKDSIKARGKRKGKVVEVKPPKGKASTTSMSFRAGKRGGLNRATTLIMAPRLTRALVKQRCIDLFGSPQIRLIIDADSKEENMYEDHEESTSRCRSAASSASIKLGLGVGACSSVTINHEKEANARLGMGFSLGTVIAKRFKASH